MSMTLEVLLLGWEVCPKDKLLNPDGPCVKMFGGPGKSCVVRTLVKLGLN
jgi:hypothetical protein